MDFKIITIDGGAASGKSSTAKLLADKLGFLYVDTGAHYRAFSFILLSKGFEAKESPDLLSFINSLSLVTKIEGNQAILIINDELVNAQSLKSGPVNSSVSYFAVLPSLRACLSAYQKSMVGLAMEKQFKGIVMEGRDIGSAIFPDSPFRFFLTADPAVRILRRNKEGIVDSILERDRLDSTRAITPLACPVGAHCIDTSHSTIERVVAEILSYLPLPT